MTSEEIREAIQTIAKRRRDRTCIDARGQYDTDYVDSVSTLADAYLARLAADEQHAERIATLERERDEARAAYLSLYDALREAKSYWLEHLEIEDKPEWRKGET